MQILGFEYWQWALIIGVIGALGLWFGIRLLPIKKKQTWTILTVGSLLVAAWGSGFISTLTAGVPGLPGAPPAAGVLDPNYWYMEVSETDANLFANVGPGSAVDTITLQYWENTTGDTIVDGTGGATATATAITNAVFTITVYNDSTDNQNIVMSASIPTFYGEDENSGVKYSVIDYSTDNNRYALQFRPTGGSDRNETVSFNVDGTSTKAVTVDINLDATGCRNLDNGDFYTIPISIEGLSERVNVRIQKIGEVQ